MSSVNEGARIVIALVHCFSPKPSNSERDRAVELEFLPNPFFANTVLTKTYRYGPMPSDPTQEPVLVSIENSAVEWKGRQDLTAAQSGARRSPASSFFCLFSKGEHDEYMVSINNRPPSRHHPCLIWRRFAFHHHYSKVVDNIATIFGKILILGIVPALVSCLDLLLYCLRSHTAAL